jgi:hypothetical protein
MNMNYIKHLTGFFDKVAKDKLLNPTHVSLYIALFQFWNCNRFRNPISISRDEVMRISKISSKATYHKCLKALHSQGYINYEPSYNPFKGSHVFLLNFADDLKPLLKSEKSASLNFSPVAEQAVGKSQTGSGAGSEQVDEQVLVPSINNINNTNIKNISKSLNAGEPEKETGHTIFKVKNIPKEKSSAKKEKSQTFADTIEKTESGRQKVGQTENALPPELEQVLLFFNEHNYPELEANKFFNYFQSIGWLVGGRTQMVDWPAAARNWMLNVPKFTSNERTDRTRHFDSTSGKDYSEPL